MIIVALGERGEVVITPGCEPGTREFDSHRSPQNRILTLIHCQSFFIHKLKFIQNIIIEKW